MTTLYYYPGNASLAPHMVLRELGVPFRLERVDRDRNAQKSPEYRRLNPAGRIPTLVDGETVLFESAAICLYLADRHPEAGLAPAVGTAERAHLYKWLMFLTNTIQPEMMAFFYPETRTTDPAGVPGLKAAAEQRATGFFRLVDDALAERGPYLLGETLSVADFFLLMLGRWGRKLALPPRDLPNLGGTLELLRGRPSVQAAIDAEQLPEPFF